MSGKWRVVDTEGRVYGYYNDRDDALDAKLSAERGYPWRLFRLESA